MNMNSGTTIKTIQDIMRKDVGVDGDAQRISQLIWMIFLKNFDYREQELEMLNEAYKSPMPEKLRWRNWAGDPEGMTGDELLDFVNDHLFPGLKDLAVALENDKKALTAPIVHHQHAAARHRCSGSDPS
jgi:type I restriction enzyme M protein